MTELLLTLVWAIQPVSMAGSQYQMIHLDHASGFFWQDLDPPFVLIFTLSFCQ